MFYPHFHYQSAARGTASNESAARATASNESAASGTASYKSRDNAGTFTMATVTPHTQQKKSAVTPLSNSSLFCQPVMNNSEYSPLMTGYKVADIDLDVEWTHQVTEHTLQCKRTKWEVIRRDKWGFEVIEHYRCRGCGNILIKWSDVDEKQPDSNKHRGPPASNINRALPTAMFASATSPQKIMELFGGVGIAMPSHSSLFSMYNQVKEDIIELTENYL